MSQEDTRDHWVQKEAGYLYGLAVGLLLGRGGAQ